MRVYRTALPTILFCLARVSLAQTAHGIEPLYIDNTCAPCQDFYRFANGSWIDHAKLPDSHSVRLWGSQ